MTDMILIPYNKAVGSIELNKYIANYIAKRDKQVVHEVVAGYNKHYFAVGDKIFHEREEAVIVDIKINGLYTGRPYQEASEFLDRWGHNSAGQAKQVEGQPIDDVEMLLNIDIGTKMKNERTKLVMYCTSRKLWTSMIQRLFQIQLARPQRLIGSSLGMSLPSIRVKDHNGLKSTVFSTIP
jgi:hypothetical protein